ncbi:hypothetical protein NL676_013456 [Syzygium grande]|nr:hypothetical protein NL676_013456 [Syzygium grande]
MAYSVPGPSPLPVAIHHPENTQPLLDYPELTRLDAVVANFTEANTKESPLEQWRLAQGRSRPSPCLLPPVRLSNYRVLPRGVEGLPPTSRIGRSNSGVPGMQGEHNQGEAPDVLHSTVEHLYEKTPLAFPGPLDHIHHHMQGLHTNSHSSSEDDLSADERGGFSDSEGNIMDGHAVFSPPTTRSRSLASSTIEDPVRASLGPVPPMNCPDATPGPSSPEKGKKRRSRKGRK